VRRTLILALVTMLLSGAATAAISVAWANDLASPRVTVLGAGNRLSLLVTAGEARLLIATGNDATHFGNALAQARHPTTRRIDILLVAGQGDDLIAPASIRNDASVRYAAAITPLDGAPAAFVTAGEGLPPLATPRRFRLNDEISVIVETHQSDAVGDTPAAAAWRVLVRRGATTVVVLSDGMAASAFPSPGAVAAVVVAGENPPAAWSSMPAPILILGGSDVIEGRELRAAAKNILDEERWALRVHPGEALPLRFVESGLAVPREPAEVVGGTPAADR